VRRLSIALSTAVLVAGVFAAPVGGGSSSVKPTAVKAGKAPAKPKRVCMGFEF
jgi:hypothetical protein